MPFLGFVAGLISVIMIMSVFGGVGEVTTHSQSQFQGNEGACEISEKITMTDILAPNQFFPVIPEECSTTPDGQPVPLSLAVVPDVAIRFFGALASLVFYLFFFVAVFSGIQWTYGGIDEKQALQAKQNFRDSFIGLVLVVSVYVVINTIVVNLLRVQFDYTDMDQFFTI